MVSDRQEAILAAITEKDAHIAVIEMTPHMSAAQTVPEVERLTHDKHELQKKLKELVSLRGSHVVCLCTVRSCQGVASRCRWRRA